MLPFSERAAEQTNDDAESLLVELAVACGGGQFDQDVWLIQRHRRSRKVEGSREKRRTAKCRVEDVVRDSVVLGQRLGECSARERGRGELERLQILARQERQLGVPASLEKVEVDPTLRSLPMNRKPLRIGDDAFKIIGRRHRMTGRLRGEFF